MAFDLYSIEYLKTGSERQRRAYESLRELGILERMTAWAGDEPGLGEAPALAGSLPLDLALDDSDVDVVSYSPDLKSFGGIYDVNSESTKAFRARAEFRLVLRH